MRTCTLDELTLVVTVCRSCAGVLIAAKEHRAEFTDAEQAVINKIAARLGMHVRWERRTAEFRQHAHCHLE